MQIVVKAKPKAKKECVELLSKPTLNFEDTEPEPDIYKVSVKGPPVGGKANEAIIKALAKYFNVSNSKVILISGSSSKHKIFDILEL